MRYIQTIIFIFFCFTLSHAQIRITVVSPHDTDPEINTFTEGRSMHVVYFDTVITKRNQLYVFLPGTNGYGFGAPELNKTAALSGYHVISLQYPDDVSLSTYKNLADPKVYSLGREEIITGKNVSEQFNVNRANSIENRLIKLLIYLSNKFPAENWSQFLDKKNDLVWEKIAIAGHSQGGGHAAFIAKKHKVARVLMFGSPKDFSVYYNAPADWLSWKSETPEDRYFTFVHSFDDKNGCTFPQQIEIWKTLGMYNLWQLVNIDSVAFPFQHSHIITSTKPQQNPHGCVVSDVSYRNIWKYMLTE